MNKIKLSPPGEARTEALFIFAAGILFLILLALACGAKRDLEENIPIQYEMRHVEGHYGNCEDSASACAEITIRYPAIIQAPTSAAEDSLNDFIKKFIMQNSETDAAQDYQMLINEFLGEYQGLVEDNPSYKVRWYDRKYVSIISDTFEILSLAYDEDIYTGGAHPNSVAYYANLTHYGRRLELTDLLNKGYWPVLNSIADSIFRKINNIVPGKNLNDVGYWFENGEFHLNENFYVNGTGLTFYFNPYEVGPYSKGSTKMVIPFADIKDYIRKDGPLGVVLKNL